MVELHLHRSSRPGFAGIVSNGFGEALEPVKNIKLQPCDGFVLAASVLHSQSFKEVDHASCSTIFFAEIYIVLELPLQ